MKNLIKDLWLAIVLIMGASALLLLSDSEQRQGQEKNSVEGKDLPSIAIMQIRSTPILDAHVQGIMDRLEELQLIAPDKSNIKIFNPQGDLGTANTIAREIANGPFDYVITSSTLSLQTFANANKATGKLHIFGGVTDPYGTGVGITGPEVGQHPPYMCGIGTFQPVESAFKVLHELHPGLKKVGVVWNPGEQCSEACVILAREVCEILGIELVEAIATNTSEVAEATKSLLAKGVEAIWIGGDTVANASTSLIVMEARQFGIPVFTNDPGDTGRGALFGIGADYHTVGVYTANLAYEVIRGKKPSEMKIENVIPEVLTINHDVLQSLGNDWNITPEVRKLLDQSNQQNDPNTELLNQKVVVPKQNAADWSGLSRKFKLRMVLYSETEFAERSKEGIMDGLAKAGLLEGTHFEMKHYNAQGDMSTLSSIMNTVKSDKVDILFAVSTPALQAALRQAGPDTKIVFTGVGDAVRAGAGTTEAEHLPHVTGITTSSSFDGMAKLILATLPAVKSMGTLFTPAEINSVLYKDWFSEALEKLGVKLIAVPVTSSTDITQAATELCRNDIQAVCQVVDNLTRPGFALIARKAAEKNLPVYVFDSDQMKDGGAICLARDYYDAGIEAAEKAAMILKGASPGTIPFNNTRSEKMMYNPGLVNKYNLKLSDSFRQNAIAYQNN